MPRISPEKSNFARTCNLLSHYIKEKGSPRDLNLGITGKVDTTFSEKPSQISTQIVKPLNLFPEYSTTSTQDSTTETIFSEEAQTEPRNAQMTIFYGGQVLVFDEFSADKAKEVMAVATKAVTPNTSLGKCVNSTSSVSNSNSIYQSIRPENRYRLQSELPLTRTPSLQRFLSRRKERASARAPYQLNKSSAESGKVQFDLNF